MPVDAKPPHADLEVLHRLLVAVIKVALAPDASHAVDWHKEAVEAHGELLALPRADNSEPDIEVLWHRAVKAAEADPVMVENTTRVSLALPQMCPVTLRALAGPTLAIDALARDIRQSTATG